MANVANKIDGKLVNLQISTDLVTPVWKTVVCGQDVGIDGSKDVNTVRTKCGVLKSSGDTSWTLTGSGVANHTPEATELSADELVAIMQGDTDILARLTHATDDELYYRQGQGIMTAYSESAGEGDPISFDFTIEISGDLIIVAP